MKRVVLVGGGHAHLIVITHAREFHSHGIQLSLVDPGLLWYSGMATGMLAGNYRPEEDCIDLRALCESHQVEFYPTKAVELNADSRQISLESGEALEYDLLSFNVGSAANTSQIHDPQSLAWTVKPIPNLLDLKAAIERALTAGGRLRIGVVGGGPTGCEIAANIDALCRRVGGSYEVTILNAHRRILSQFPAGAARKLTKVLQRRGIRFLNEARVTHIAEAGDAVLARAEQGGEFVCDELVLASGLVPSPTIQQLRLGDNGLRVADTLAAVDLPGIFGAGDCISFSGGELPKVGVYGVRQAPVLKDNLLAAALNRKLRSYAPQKQYLIILNLGDGTGLAMRGRWYWLGRLSYVVKNIIDQRFMSRFR